MMHKNIFTTRLFTLIFAVICNFSFELTAQNFIPLANTIPSVSKNTSSVNETGELKITWNSISGAKLYQIEWTWVDSYSNDINNSKLEVDEIKFSDKDFAHNNTRVETDKLYYNIPLIYGQGYVLFRVRALGYFSASKKSYKYTKWSTFTDRGKTYISHWNIARNGYEIQSGHFSNLNWQFQSSFAEQGKKKEVISYFDGSLRNRQTVTKINSDKHVVVGEVIYDAQGRPAIEVLPVPIEKQKIEYQSNFTLNNAASPEVYTYTDFDIDNANVIDETTDVKAMSNTSGASQYYSQNNNVLSVHKDYIPDAQLYPFSQIEYTADNTGRIKRKSGVGLTHQLGNGKEMEYYYGVPTQKELNRLFGYSVGNAAHYKKNLVIDPNDQSSVSYIDPQGRTIATALVASSPNNLDGLKDEKAGEALHKLISDNFFDSSNVSPNGNTKNATGNFGNIPDQINFSASKLSVNDNEKYTFNYSVAPLPALNFECYEDISSVFNLVIEARDRDQALLFREEQAFFGNRGTSIEKKDVSIKRGSFSVSKKITINKEKLEQDADEFIEKLQDENNTDCFVDNSDAFFLPPILQEGCYTTCEECKEDLFGFDANGVQITNEQVATTNYVNRLMANYDFSEIENLTQQEKDNETRRLEDLFEQQFKEFIKLCSAPCETSVGNESISCQIIKGDLLEDMKPYGQYGFGTTEITNFSINNVSSRNLNIYNSQNELYSARAGNEQFNSWRNPSHPELDPVSSASTLNNTGHYYNTDGTISFVTVKVIREVEFERIENENAPEGVDVVENEIITFDPEIPTDLFSESQLIGKTTVEVEPQYLLNLRDFISEGIWQDSWAESLLKYHPEYAYLEYSQTECGRTATVAGEVMNSDAFDLYINGITTYAEAVEANLFTDITNNSTNGNLFKIASLDPYFSANSNTDPANNRSKIIREALEENFDGGGGPMMSYALGIVICNSISPCEELDPAISSRYTETQLVQQINNRSIEDQNRFWNVYKTNYISLKQRIQTVFSNLYASNQNAYNGCIGNKPAPTKITDLIIDYKDSTLNAIEDSLNSTQSICDDPNRGEYYTKNKRFISADSGYNSSADPEEIFEQTKRETKFDYYITTGTCPLGLDMELFLNYYFKETETDLVTKIPAVRDVEYTGQYLSIDLFQELGGDFPQPSGSSFNIKGQALSSNELKIDIETTNAQQNRQPTTLKLQNLPAVARGINWNNYTDNWSINEVTRFYYTNYNQVTKLFSFEILAKIELLPNNTYEEIIITGTTPARVGECSIGQANGIGEFLTGGPGNSSEASCSIENDFNAAMTGLVEKLVATNQINASNLNLSNIAEYRDSYLTEFLGSSSASWQANGSTYTISVSGSTVLTLTLERVLSTTATPDVRNFSTSYVKSPDDTIIGQNIVISYGRRRGGSASTNRIQGRLTVDGSRLVNMLCCGNINESITVISTNPCENLLSNLVDGSFEKPIGRVFTDGAILGQANASGFRSGSSSETPDTFLNTTVNTPFVGNHPPSPIVNGQGGGAFLGLHGYTANNETIKTNIDIKEGATYKIIFDQAYGGRKTGLRPNNNQRDSQRGDISNFIFIINGQSISGPPISFTGFGSQRWERAEVEFTATETVNQAELTIDVLDSSTVCHYLTIDNFGVFEDCNNDSCNLLQNIVDGTFDGLRDIAGGGEGVNYRPVNANITSANWINGDLTVDSWLPPINPALGSRRDILAKGMPFSPQTPSIGQQNGGVFAGALVTKSRDSESFYTILSDLQINKKYKISFYQANAGYTLKNIKEEIGQGAPAGWSVEIDNKAKILKSKEIPFLGFGNQEWEYVELEFTSQKTSLRIEFRPYTTSEDVLFVDFQAYMAIDDIRIVSEDSECFNNSPGHIGSQQNNSRVGNNSEDILTRLSNRNNTRDCDQGADFCIPQPIKPISCSDKFVTYTSVLNQLNNPVDVVDTKEEFCASNFAYLVDDYNYYLNIMGVFSSTEQNKTNDLFYISIGRFGATPFNYGYQGNSGRGMRDVIDAYKIKVDSLGDISVNAPQTWNTFAISYFNGNENTSAQIACPPVILPQNSGGEPLEIPVATESECEQFKESIQLAYKRDNYTGFLERKREAFVNHYLSFAINNLEESFNLSFLDKEYQYTLYYYDQAGNLQQTVPPEGVNRFSDEVLETQGINAAINEYRNSGSQNVQNERSDLLPNHNLQTKYKYNTLNQLVWQQTPDGGITTFAYDELGRIIASQNAKQKLTISNALRCGSVREQTNISFKVQNNLSINGLKEIQVNEDIDPREEITMGVFRTELSKDGYVEYSQKREYVEIYTDSIEKVDEDTNEVYFEKFNRARALKQTFVGLSNKANIANRNDIEYGVLSDEKNNQIIFNNNGELQARQAVEENLHKDKDRIRIERSSGIIYYYVNGELIDQQTEKSATINDDLSIAVFYDRGKDKIYDIVIGNYSSEPNCPKVSDFSYTLYDQLGRIVEAGELTPNSDIVITDTKGRLQFAGNQTASSYVSSKIENSFPRNISNNQRQVTKTVYTKNAFRASQIFNYFDQNDYEQNIRNRVSAIYYFENYAKGTSLSSYDNAIYYNYDIHGNVKEMVQHNKALSTDASDFFSGAKHVNYEYDLISGNVNRVVYQKGQEDQFMHKYTYDADNRITAVHTSKDGSNWEKDADYKYYAHGPLARVLLGERKVQAMDYVYTLQGWLKGVNSDANGQDVGNDGIATSDVAKDAYGYSLSYYNDDYLPIGGITPFSVANSGNNQTNNNLYNGNIKGMATHLLGTNEAPLGTLQNKYEYDQLNRIVSFTGVNQSSATAGSYSANYAYDRNGNLSELTRSEGTNQFDDFKYHYNTELVNGKEVKLNNQLLSVEDSKGANEEINDLLDQKEALRALNIDADKNPTHNYIYDAIGQLVEDRTEGLRIEWRVDGKVSKVIKGNHTATTDDDQEIVFDYDGLGNRIGKRTIKNSLVTDKSYYARDAQGNVLAVYGRAEFESENDAPIVQINSTISSLPSNTNKVMAQNKITSTVVVPAAQNLNLKAGNCIVLLPGAEYKEGTNSTLLIKPINEIIEEASFSEQLALEEHHIYGSSRLGILKNKISLTTNESTNSTLGNKNYELSNHLGNVLSVITDEKVNIDTAEELEIDVVAYAEDFEDDFDVNNHPSWNNNTVQSVSRSKTLVFASENDNENIEFDFKAEIGNQYSVSFNFLYKQSNSNVVFEIIEVSSNRIIHEEKLRTPNLESDLFESIVTPVFIANSENYVIRWKKIGSEFSVVYLEDFKIKTKEIVTLNSTPDVIAYNDYYPFGMLLPNRHGSSDKYRYGYNGMEKDDELKGEGNSYDYGMRMYDPRIARWQRTDPLQYRFPHVSTYAYAFNNPVALVDVDGEYPKPSEILKGVGIENPIALGLADGFVEGLGWLDTAEMAYKLSTDAGFREQFIDGLAAIASDPIGFAASVADEYIERGKKIVGGGDEGKYELGRAIGELAGGAVSGGGALKLLKFAKKFKGSKLAKKARNKLPCGCFTEKTQIYTESGYKDIKDIQTGDIVWAYNDKTKEKQLQEVVNTFKLERDHIYKIYFANEVIEATDDHPFFIGGQWLKVKDLREGDKLTMYDGSEDAITKIEYIAGIFIVYNFEVENDHTYYVTHENVLVHNSGPCDIGQKRVGQLIENKRKGKIGEEILKAELDEIYPVGQGFKILEQASFKIKGVKGKSARPDFTIIDGEGKIVALIDAKTGNAVFTNNQVQLANNGGVLTIGKKTKDRLKKLGFVDSDGNIDIDTNVDSGEFIPETIPNSKIKAASN